MTDGGVESWHPGGVVVMPSGLRIGTERMELVAVTADLAILGAADGNLLADAIGARALGWPGASGYKRLAAAIPRLRRDPSLAGWLDWLWIRTELPSARVVIGSGGFSDRPGPDRTAHFQFALWGMDDLRGHASEGSRALVRWALRNGASRVVADVPAAQSSIVRILDRVGFRYLRNDPTNGSVRVVIDEVDDEVSGVRPAPGGIAGNG